MIEVEGLSITSAAGPILRDVGLHVAPGERLGVVGESGSGKTLLAMSLMGMVPDGLSVTGSIRIDGAEMCGADESAWRRLRARRMAMIFQEPMSALNPLRRVGDTVAEPLIRHLGLAPRAARDKALALFDETGILDPERRLSQYPHQLSGGQRQRVLIALALACDPELLIADEPTTALDANVALRITRLLVRLAEERRMGLLFISHDLAAVSRTTERLMVMYGGDVVETGATAEVLRAPAHPYTAGLLSARPSLAAHGKRRLPTIPGSVPPPQELPRGCRFSGRCGQEIARCAAEMPQPVTTAPDSWAACHLLQARAKGAGA
ncbi:ABC transporter ATP-binding protein [Aquicoccus porphyridii]|uniref:ABC transporter ATP-binding protein n=1 Tax=Aquicoccus porphyridii TaxID=1852029 RepID=A0A5A9ZV99_9RHOB|nr:ABC transporter ATP-binding protein [Aquicoccus porphyridii]KAA0921109.1 ABC transporter ATP-binding protein [Aquicoccus porphyridii]RAI56357.1 ABC transporter ATP-binding protein [Rhodobacteraceae bacterium AsT-22]